MVLDFIEIKHFSRCVFWWVGQGIFDRFWKPLTCLTVSALLLFVLSNILFGELNMVFSSRFSRIMLHRRTFWCGYWLILLCLQHFPRYLITFSSAHLRYSFPEKIFLIFFINVTSGDQWLWREILDNYFGIINFIEEGKEMFAFAKNM